MSKDLALDNTMWDVHTNTDIVPLEFTEEIKPDLFGLETLKATEMVSGLSVTIAERKALIDAYSDVIDLEITAENLKTFKDLRLKIVKNRTQGLDVWKKTEKAFFLAGSNFVDAVYKKELAINTQMESKLMEAEKFFENQQKAIAKELNDARLERLQPYVTDTTGLDFAQMNDYDFDDYLLGKKTRFENEQKERDAELLRIEIERLKVIENNRRQLAIAPYLQFTDKASLVSEMQLSDFENLLIDCQNAKTAYDKKQTEIAKENARLKAEADAKQTIQDAKDLQIENERKAEKVKSDAIAKQLQDKIDAENEIIASQKLYAENLAKANVNEQLKAWIETFEIGLPLHLKHNDTAKDICDKFINFKSWCLGKI